MEVPAGGLSLGLTPEEVARRELLEAKKIWFDELVGFMGTLESPLAVYGLFTLYDWNYQIGDYDLAGIEAILAKFQDARSDTETTLLADVQPRRGRPGRRGGAVQLDSAAVGCGGGTIGASLDQGKLIHLSVRRQTYSHLMAERGFS